MLYPYFGANVTHFRLFISKQKVKLFIDVGKADPTVGMFPSEASTNYLCLSLCLALHLVREMIIFTAICSSYVWVCFPNVDYQSYCHQKLGEEPIREKSRTRRVWQWAV